MLVGKRQNHNTEQADSADLDKDLNKYPKPKRELRLWVRILPSSIQSKPLFLVIMRGSPDPITVGLFDLEVGLLFGAFNFSLCNFKLNHLFHQTNAGGQLHGWPC